ncbi:lysine--tRNA ligase [Azospirillum oryzae]|uniref:Lysine--tRNA ligase n=1 Tax=Azospirillum oryzae TaxID=286727 RepID=A0A6N1AHW7_9PROT|nr:lysine--tRNA ligase [Azospirillum oryzae]KAA0589355.1 lysine--tRNA ligase [Azospirillum oryzae]QKS51196.1 lysine--tRNA ligase [Azospirillum oryzae]GLR79517.1 lysine--tRNA ligase [Azospirillum oryzae]
MTGERDLALQAKAWPFEEARKLVARFAKAPPAKGYVLFETGYGPSGLPHLGTFGEVARTSMVRHAFQTMSDIPTRLFCFSDDMDGLRKVPDNIPNKEMVAANLGKPLTQVPDPFGTHDSFGAHNNARLRAFLDSFGFEYEFQSSTDWYKSGRFDEALLGILRHYDEVMAVMLPTLGAERQATYSPFLPVSPSTGRVLQVPMLERDVDAGTIVFEDEDGKKVELPVTGGHVKLQWKPDWGMRWFGLGVDYEMYGKDLIPSADLAGKICKILGGTPPEGFNYELFLDDKGQKISKSKGNGLTMEEWLAYAPQESLALYMFQKPKSAKRLYFDVIPRAVDEYLTFVDKVHGEEPAKKLENPAWHIHNGKPPAVRSDVSFNLLLNLAGAANADTKDTMWGFIRRYAPDATPENSPFLDSMVGYAVRYYQDQVKPTKRFRAPTDAERAALQDLLAKLDGLPADARADTIQNEVFEVGKTHGFTELRAWFQALYEVLLGQTTGPRMGSFIQLYGIDETKALIREKLAA